MGTLKLYRTGTGWEPIGAAPTNLPPGGATNALLAKQSAADGVVGWTRDLNVNAVFTSTVTPAGYINMLDNVHIYLGSSGGTRIGMAASQKLGFWNTTPVIQNAGWYMTPGYAALKSWNPATATLAETARVLATLVDTLKSYGLLGP